MASRSRYPPVVKTVLRPKRKLLPVVAPNNTTTQAQSEDDVVSDTGEESQFQSCEKLRDANHHHPDVCLPQALQAVGGDLKLQFGRSPAVESLGDILEIQTTSSDDSSSSSSQEFNMTMATKMSDVMTSTMLDGRKKQKLNLDDISVIKTRESLDPRRSGQPMKKEEETLPDIRRQNRSLGPAESLVVSGAPNLSISPLSSTPTRSSQKKTQSCHSLELTSLHSSETGESMLVPREMVTEERLGETSPEDEKILCSPEKHTDTKQVIDDNNKIASPPLTHPMSPLITVIPDTDSETDPELPFVCQYPPPPHTGGVRITIPDYQTLNKGIYLNDNIIDFYLNYLFREKLSAQLEGKVFIFSSYFYKRLTADPVEGSMMAIMERDLKLPLAQKRHRRVLNWTKAIKLSQHELVVFPICKNSHWFLVTAVMTRDRSFLVVMDSLGGVNREVVALIKEYLIIELNMEEGYTNLEEVKKIELVQSCLPQQDNYTDCGLYLLHYVEKMLERPQDILCIDDHDLSTWFPKSEVAGKRSSLALLIRQITEDQAMSGQIPTLPDLLGELEDGTLPNEDPKFVATENDEDADNIFNIIKAELSNLSPPANRSRSSDTDKEARVQQRISSSSSDLSGGVGGVEPYPPNGRGKKRFWMAERKKQPVFSFFSKAEYYRGKQSSERKFDQFVEEEMMDKEERVDVFSQEE